MTTWHFESDNNCKWKLQKKIVDTSLFMILCVQINAENIIILKRDFKHYQSRLNTSDD